MGRRIGSGPRKVEVPHAHGPKFQGLWRSRFRNSFVPAPINGGSVGPSDVSVGSGLAAFPRA